MPKVCSERVAGPRVTAPLVLYCDPWHGHVNVPDEKPETTHCSCVQTAVSALKLLSAVRATRKLPEPVCTSAALPTFASADALTFSMRIDPPEAVAFIVGSAGTFVPPPPGFVGLPFPPPQPSMSEVIVTSDTACAQNSRRVGLSFSMAGRHCNPRTGLRGPASARQAVSDIVDSAMWRRFLAIALAVPLLTADADVLSAAQRQRPLPVSISPSVIRPGDVILVEIDGTGDGTFTASLFARPVPLEYDDASRRWRALVGVDLDTKPGTYRLRIVGPPGSATTAERVVRITARQFRSRYLRVAPEFVDPPEAVIAQIRHDAKQLDAVYARRTPRQWSGAFVRPVDGPASSNFGTRSYYNGERRSPHAGVDFSAPSGTPVRASNAGTVALAAALYFTGNTVVIDHGARVFSIFAHLSEINVAEGETVRPETIVGLVGATGRVTAPHLHWSVRLDGARVDPLALMETTKRW